MDEFKPEDELKPDPSDRRTGRSRQSSERDNEPQINFDDVDLDADDRRPARARKERDEEQDIEEDYESDDDVVDEERVERRPRKRKKAVSKTSLPSVHYDGCGCSGTSAADCRYRFCAEGPLIFLFQRAGCVW